MKRTYFINILLIGSTISLTSCARQISSDIYASSNVGEVSTTYAGIIRNVRPVIVDGSEQLGDNATGLVGGGAAGSLVGNACGGGLLSMAAGAAVGALGGAFVEKKLKQQSALEYIVQLEDGSLMTIVQGEENAFIIGQPVYVIVGQFGRSRIISQSSNL